MMKQSQLHRQLMLSCEQEGMSGLVEQKPTAFDLPGQFPSQQQQQPVAAESLLRSSLLASEGGFSAGVPIDVGNEGNSLGGFDDLEPVARERCSTWPTKQFVALTAKDENAAAVGDESPRQLTSIRETGGYEDQLQRGHAG